MIPSACKRLAEVDFPIADVSCHAAREKSIRYGHPSTLHLWWARRPLASSRAVLMALLLPDPCDDHCPEAFKREARRVLLDMCSRASGWNAEVVTDAGLRRVLLGFIADFANWDNAASLEYLDTGRALVRVAHPRETPLVVDPFAGGGSSPLEALRLGCEAFASGLNPVGYLILKVMLEEIPRHGPGLANELWRVGAEKKAKAEEELADLYPKEPDGATRRVEFEIFEPPACVSQTRRRLRCNQLPPNEDGRTRSQGTDDDPFRHTVAGVDALVHEGQERAQFEEEPHRRVQRNPGRHRSLRQRIPPAN